MENNELLKNLDENKISVAGNLIQAEKLFSHDMNYGAAEAEYIEALEAANNNRLNYNHTQDYNDIVVILKRLADINLAKADDLTHNETRNIRQLGNYVIKAVMLYNAALTINKNFISDKSLHKCLIACIKSSQELFVKKIKEGAVRIETWEADKQHRIEWKKINEYSKKELIQVDSIKIKSFEDQEAFYQRAKLVEKIYETIAENIKYLLGKMIEECISTLGHPPCQYAFICFGSLAKSSATPYSDIEFGILLEETQDTEINKLYFLKLSYLLGFKIINLGQTIIPKDMFKTQAGLEVDLDDILIPGFQLDLGGKTPLGRIDRNYDLIATPSEMAKYVQAEYFDIDKFLPIDILGSNYIYKSKRLFVQLKENIKIILKKDIFNKMYFEILAENIALKGYSSLTPDLDKYNIKIDLYPYSGKFFDVKQEIYRIPDRLIDNLALLINQTFESPWKKIKLILNSNWFNNLTDIQRKNASKNLKILLSIAKDIRLRTYAANGGQKEFAYNNIHRNISSDSIESDKFLDINFILRFYFTAIPAFKITKNIFKNYLDSPNHSIHRNLFKIIPACAAYFKSMIHPNKHINKAISLYENSALNKGFVHKRLHQYEVAIEHFESIIFDNNYASKTKMLAYYQLGDIKHHLKKFKQARSCYLKAIDIYEKLNLKNIFIVKLLNGIGQLYLSQGNYEGAEFYFKRALELMELLKLNTKYNEYTVLLRVNLGLIYTYDETKVIQQISEQFNLALAAANGNKIFISLVYLHKGISYFINNDYNNSILYYKKALKIQQKNYSNKNGYIEIIQRYIQHIMKVKILPNNNNIDNNNRLYKIKNKSIKERNEFNRTNYFTSQDLSDINQYGERAPKLFNDYNPLKIGVEIIKTSFSSTSFIKYFLKNLSHSIATCKKLLLYSFKSINYLTSERDFLETNITLQNELQKFIQSIRINSNEYRIIIKEIKLKESIDDIKYMLDILYYYNAQNFDEITKLATLKKEIDVPNPKISMILNYFQALIKNNNLKEATVLLKKIVNNNDNNEHTCYFFKEDYLWSGIKLGDIITCEQSSFELGSKTFACAALLHANSHSKENKNFYLVNLIESVCLFPTYECYSFLCNNVALLKNEHCINFFHSHPPSMDKNTNYLSLMKLLETLNSKSSVSTFFTPPLSEVHTNNIIISNNSQEENGPDNGQPDEIKFKFI